MSLKQFTLQNLEQLDGGKALRGFEQLLGRIITDCLDRSSEKKPRKITLQIEVVPIPEPDGMCERVESRISIKASVPDMKSRVYSMGLRQSQSGGMLVFSPDSPENVDQSILFDEDK